MELPRRKLLTTILRLMNHLPSLKDEMNERIEVSRYAEKVYGLRAGLGQSLILAQPEKSRLAR